MTSPDQIAADPLTAISHSRHLALELSETLKLAIPLALTQLGQIAMMTTDIAMIGRLGSEAMAAAALAHTVFFVSFTFGMGLVSAVAPLAAQAFGARNPHLIRRSLRVGMWAALLMSLPMMALLLRGEQILLMLGQAPTSAHLAQQYLLGLAWGMLPALWFMAIRGFMSAVNRPEPILWITLAAIPANAALVYVLLYGAFGLPELGLFGVGLASSIVNLATFLAGLWFATRRRPFRKYHVLGHFWRTDWQLMRKLVIIGAPISISFLLEYGLFGAAGLLMGVISTTALAAHQIALQVAAILYMVPFGISMAATVRVGHAVGRGDAGGVRRAGYIATWLGIVLAAILTLAVIISRFGIAEVFLGESTDTTAELSATLLLVGSTLFIADAIQTIAAGALRGMNDTRIPLLFAVLSYWLIGFACACWLGFWTSSGAVGVWIGLSVGTAIFAILLLLRFRALTSKLTFSMTVREITPAVDADTLLSGAQFADAFCVEVADRDLDARRAAERMMARQPRWAEALVSLRNFLVSPLGLKTSGATPGAPREMIGIFPVVSETPDRLIAGFNDSHLDFRVVVDVTTPGGIRQVTLTTLVKTHNWTGAHLSRDHPPVSPADRARFAASGDNLRRWLTEPALR